MTKTEWMNTLTDEGYVHLNVCSMEQETDFGEHTHDMSTVHVILKGSLTMTDENGSVTIGPGERSIFKLARHIPPNADQKV